MGKAMVSHLDDILRNKSVAIVLLAAIECAPDCEELSEIFAKICEMLCAPLKMEVEVKPEKKEVKKARKEEVKEDEEDEEDEDEDEEEGEEEEQEKMEEDEVEDEKKEDVKTEEPLTTTIENLVCDACGHWVVKNIIQLDKKRKENNCETMFSSTLCDAVAPASLAEWATFNRGSFVLVALVECGVEGVKEKVVNNCNLPDAVKEDDTPGLKLLYKLVKGV